MLLTHVFKHCGSLYRQQCPIGGEFADVFPSIFSLAVGTADLAVGDQCENALFAERVAAAGQDAGQPGLTVVLKFALDTIHLSLLGELTEYLQLLHKTV